MHESENWEMLAHHHIRGVPQISYLSDSGEICTLPAEFVEALTEDVYLDVRFVPLTTDTSRLNLIRGGQIDAVIPQSLLRVLMTERDQLKSHSKTPSESQFPSHSQQ